MSRGQKDEKNQHIILNPFILRHILRVAGDNLQICDFFVAKLHVKILLSLFLAFHKRKF